MGAFFFELKRDGNIDTPPVETCTMASFCPYDAQQKGRLAPPFSTTLVFRQQD